MCVESLKKLSDVEYKIILVDNNSRCEVKRELREYVKINECIYFIESNHNNGYAGGNNLALRYALSQADMEYCWVLNNDTIVEPDSLSLLVDYMNHHKQVGLCGSKLIYEWDRSKIQGYGACYNPALGTIHSCVNKEDIKDIDYIIGAAVLVRKSFLEDVGLMDEGYFLYYEELDWAVRARGKYDIACVEESIVYHKEGASTGANNAEKNKSILADYYSIRNRIRFTKKFYPYFLPTVYIGLILSMVIRICRRQFNRVPMIFKLMLGIKDDRYEFKY
jgi:GT2 family glycosyltransferase